MFGTGHGAQSLDRSAGRNEFLVGSEPNLEKLFRALKGVRRVKIHGKFVVDELGDVVVMVILGRIDNHGDLEVS